MTARPGRHDPKTLLRVAAWGAGTALFAATVDIVFFNNSVPGLVVAMVLAGIVQRWAAYVVVRRRGQRPRPWWWAS